MEKPLDQLQNIPEQYRHLWKPYKTEGVLYHLTPKKNLEDIKSHGGLDPRDPSPKHWAGMTAVFLADPSDPLYEKTLPDVLQHVKDKHEEVVRLHIKTNNDLFKSVDPRRTFQVISLGKISFDDIIEVEENII